MSRLSLASLMPRPVVVAPMAGGPSTPELVATAAQCGALAFVAAGYQTAVALREEVRQVRLVTSRPIGVNVFVPSTTAGHREVATHYLHTLRDDAARLDVVLGQPSWDDDDWSLKIEALLADPVDVVSFTFGVPPLDVVRSLRGVGSLVGVTITSVHEAALAHEVDVDVLFVQGIEAGAHRGTFTNDDRSLQGSDLLSLLGAVAKVSALPLVGAGGVVDASGVNAVLRAGAVAAQCGTAFLRCPESGAHPSYKAALADERFVETALTRSFSGRVARGVVNQFMLDHPDAPPAYPEINNATRPLRARAAQLRDLDRMSLWAGTGFKHATDRPAGEIIDQLCGAST